MSSATRIYAVFGAGDVEAQALIRAKTKAAALHHYTRGHLVVNVASQEDLVDAITAGLIVEDAGDDGKAQEAEESEMRG